MFIDEYLLLCKEKGISKSKAAVEMGLDDSLPTKWEKRRENTIPDFQTLCKVSDYFGISLDWLRFRIEYWPTNEWADSLYVDFRANGMSDDSKLAMLRKNGTPPDLQSWLVQFEPEKYLSLKNENALSEGEKTLLFRYRALNQTGKDKLLSESEDMTNLKKYNEDNTGSVSKVG